MTARSTKPSFRARPGDAGARVPEPSSAPRGVGHLYTAGLTIDVTLVPRGRIKITAFERCQTVACTLHDLLAHQLSEGAM